MTQERQFTQEQSTAMYDFIRKSLNDNVIQAAKYAAKKHSAVQFLVQATAQEIINMDTLLQVIDSTPSPSEQMKAKFAELNERMADEVYGKRTDSTPSADSGAPEAGERYEIVVNNMGTARIMDTQSGYFVYNPYAHYPITNNQVHIVLSLLNKQHADGNPTPFVSRDSLNAALLQAGSDSGNGEAGE